MLLIFPCIIIQLHHDVFVLRVLDGADEEPTEMVVEGADVNGEVLVDAGNPASKWGRGGQDTQRRV